MTKTGGMARLDGKIVIQNRLCASAVRRLPPIFFPSPPLLSQPCKSASQSPRRRRQGLTGGVQPLKAEKNIACLTKDDFQEETQNAVRKGCIMHEPMHSSISSSLAGLLQVELLYSFAGPSRCCVVCRSINLLDCCEPSHLVCCWTIQVDDGMHKSTNDVPSCRIIDVVVVVVVVQ
jgi:hypothetical protein